MAKKLKAQPQQAAKQPKTVVVENTGATEKKPLFGNIDNYKSALIPQSLSRLNEFKIQAIIISVLALLLYANTFMHETAHDDGIVIVKNEYVQEGFAGIPSILTKDAYDSYYRQLNTTNQLSGGRYRPLSIVTFAIEQQLLGAVPKEKVDSLMSANTAYGVHGPQEQKLMRDMHVRHVLNVLWYILSLVVLLYFLRYIVFRTEPLMALIAAVIFAIHPIHTEVVANVKSRDEIMSLLFMCATFILTFKYHEHKQIKLLIGAMVCYFLAFLSKEYAITLVVLLPLALYVFNRYTIQKSIMALLPFGLVLLGYFFLRSSIGVSTQPGENSQNEVLNNPYLFASSAEKLATEISTTLNYLKLLIFPHPLSADYSYDSIPYKNFSNPVVWLSLIIHFGLVLAMFLLFPRRGNEASAKAAPRGVDYRGLLCFAIAFYLLHLLLVCNIFFDIGATMGERLIYHSSLGFAIAAAYFLCKGAEKIQPVATAQKALAGFMAVILILSGYKTIARNADWKNDSTLFRADLKTVPNSVLVLGNVAASDITQADFQKDEQSRQEYLDHAIKLLDHALSIHHTFVAGFLNRGIAWYKLGDIDKAKPNVDTVRTLYPTYPTLPGMYRLMGEYYMKKGWDDYGKYGKYAEAITVFKKGLEVDTTNPELWYNIGGAYYSNRQLPDAVAAWQKALRLKPDYPQARQGLMAAMAALNGVAPQPANKQGK
jgi:protein O-mannosyl-transferase